MTEAMETQDFHTVDDALREIKLKKLDIDVKLKKDAEVLHLKLKWELDIKTFIKDKLQYVEDY